MNTTTDQIFEFDDLDDLWKRIKDLKPGERLAVRNRTIMAQGMMSEIKEDTRFNEFTTYAAKHKAPFQRTDLHLFTIYKDSTRRK